MTGDGFLKRYLPISALLHFLGAAAMLLYAHVADLNLFPDKPEQKLLWIELEPKFNPQVVDSTAGKEVKEAVDDAYLGEKNREVEKETTATDLNTLDQSHSERPTPKEIANETEQESIEKAKRKVTIQDLGISIFPSVAQNRQPQGLRPEWVDYGEQFGKDSNEYIKGLNKGDQTALNTKEFIYFSYFQRIRSQLNQAWKPILRKHLTRLYRTGRAPASDMDHITRTLVVLNKDGDVIRVQLIGESGTQDLDQAAVKAFNKAGPFPNPPKGLPDDAGEIELRWDFILKT